MSMSIFEVIITIITLFTLFGVVWALKEISELKKEIAEKKTVSPNTLQLQLQAYERLSVLSERIAIQNVLTRIPNSGLSSREMQHALIDNIKTEYDYNVSQQIYIQPEIWKAVDNLKEQNIYIINQLASTLPGNASAMDLSKQIVDFLINNPNFSLHKIVHEAINLEAKKLM